MKKLIFLVLVITFSACSVTASYDYEKNTAFNKYKTFDINNDGESGLSTLDNKRINRILTEALEAQGFIKADSTASFYINIKNSEFEAAQNSNVGLGVGGTGRTIGGGISIGIPVGQAKVLRQIVFDFVDSDTNQLFWQAVTKSKFNPNGSPEQRETILKAVVEKMLSGYPPKAK